MYFAAFTTETPLHHVPRTLDELARVDYVLHELRVTPDGAQSVVEFSFRPSAKITVDCLMARLARLPGVYDLDSVAVTAGQCATRTSAAPLSA